MKNINYVIKRLSKEQNIPEPQVKKYIQFYWDQALAKVNTMEYQALFVKNVGTFYIEYNLLRRHIQKLINAIRKEPKEYKTQVLKKLLSIRGKISKHYYNLWTSKHSDK